MAQQYFDFLVEVNGVAPKTFNNIRGRLKNFYNVARKRKWTSAENPFDMVDRQATNYGEKNTAYSDQQLAEMVPYIKETDPYLWRFICFIYYAFMRPSEIRRLRVKSIDMEKRHIRILSSQSKVKKFDILPIADGLYQELLAMDLTQYPSDYYLFSNIRQPSAQHLGTGWTTEHFKLVKQHFNFGLEYSIYGFKHTSVCRWYMHEKDIVRIQKMCRHSTIEMTARYLKSLGLLTDQYKIESLPGLDF